ncbi:MAG: hypothetical protein IT209_06705 [Armatimonadetes bacterium]|nr:hypothetical protein [Armatimonadota bacterium]
MEADKKVKVGRASRRTGRRSTRVVNRAASNADSRGWEGILALFCLTQKVDRGYVPGPADVIRPGDRPAPVADSRKPGSVA